MSEKVNTPTDKAEKALDSVLSNDFEYAQLGKRKVKVRAWRNGVIRKITHIVLNEKNEHKVAAKAVALIILHRLWKIKLFYWIVWRWIYYVKEYTQDELTDVLTVAKKKARLEGFYTNTMLLIGMKDTMMAMTRKEVESFRQEHLSEHTTR